jgi:hypothetical protein
MKITTLILSASYLIVGISSILLLAGTYIYIIYKQKNLNAIFTFWEYATPKELKIIKLGSFGIVVTIIIFILMTLLTL